MLLKAFPLLFEAIHPVLWAANTLSHVFSKGSSSPRRGRYELSPTAPGEENIARDPAVDLGVGGLLSFLVWRNLRCLSAVCMSVFWQKPEGKAWLPPGGPKSTCFHRVLTGRTVVPYVSPVPPCFPAWKLYQGMKARHTLHNPFIAWRFGKRDRWSPS